MVIPAQSSYNRSNVILSELINSTEVMVKLALFFSCNQYSRDELIEQDSRIFDSGFHPQHFFEDIWNTISSGSVWKNEIKNKAKDGSFYWTDTTIVPFMDINGKPYQYVSIKIDITKQKLNANQLYKFFDLSVDYFV